jgi:hypothetical protein
MLSRVEPLGGRRPSELLTTMLELCPKGEETSSFFCYFFLQRLPREIRVLLAEEDPSNMRAIADKADKLVALHNPQGHDMVAAAATDTGSDEEEAIATAAVKYRQRKKFVKKKQHNSKHAARDDSADRGGKKTNLCFYHAKFGDKAHKCQPHHTAPGRKTRRPGCHRRGGTPWDTLLHHRHADWSPLPGGHRILFLADPTPVEQAAVRTYFTSSGQPPHSLLGLR